MRRKKWAEAAIALRKLVVHNPAYSPGAVDLAKSLVYSGRREEALGVLLHAASLEKAARRDELNRRAAVLSRMFLTQSTFQGYQEGLNFLKAGKYRQARERFEKALETESDNVEVLLRVGQCLVLDGDNDSAAERLRFARKLNPNEPEIKLWLGHALAQRGELKEAIQELRAAYLDLERSELAPVWFAEGLIASGQRAAAIEVLEEDVKTEPFHLLSLVTLARTRFEANAKDVSSVLWNVRKDLQVGLSRFDRYGADDQPRFEGELGVDLRSPEKVKTDIQALIERVDAKIDSLSAAKEE